jgi:hypothetical protein
MEARRRAALVRPAHIDAWIESGVVHRSLRPILEVRAAQVEAMVQDLGGEGEVTTLQHGVLEGWLQAQTVADVVFQGFARNPQGEIPERLLSAINSARSALLALGLQRRAKRVPSLADYMKAQASQEPVSESIDVEPGSSSVTDDERATEGDSGGVS